MYETQFCYCTNQSVMIQTLLKTSFHKKENKIWRRPLQSGLVKPGHFYPQLLIPPRIRSYILRTLPLRRK